MDLLRRRPSARTTAASDRAIGLQVGVGIGAGPASDERSVDDVGLDCERCGTAGHIEAVDLEARRASLICPRCGGTWDTDRDAVPAPPSASRPE